MRTDRINSALERAISRERLEKYLINQNDSLDGALALYEKNMLLSEAFYVPLQTLEVCLRNKIHAEMVSFYGPDWLTNPPSTPMNDFSRSMINEALRELQAAPTNGQIVAELKFAFWVGLMGPGYDATLWRRAIHKCFRSSRGKRRSEVHGQLNAIRRFRNRVAHHEPIFHRPIERLHGDIIEAIGWMCPQTRDWTLHHSRVLQILNSN